MLQELSELCEFAIKDWFNAYIYHSITKDRLDDENLIRFMNDKINDIATSRAKRISASELIAYLKEDPTRICDMISSDSKTVEDAIKSAIRIVFIERMKIVADRIFAERRDEVEEEGKER